MTSATSPSGVVSADSSDSGNVPYYAFDRDNTTYWYASDTLASGLTEHYVQYDFGAKTSIKKAKVLISGHSVTDYTYSYAFYGSDDGTTFALIASGTTQSVNMNTNYTINETLDSDYRYYRFGIKSSLSDNITSTVKTLELLDYAPKGCVPVMTSNTAPYGTASASSYTSGHDSYCAFDENESTSWALGTGESGQTSSTGYIEYTFTNPTKVNKISYKQASNVYFTKAKLVQSNDNFSTQTVVAENISLSSGIGSIDIPNDDYALSYRLYVQEVGGTGTLRMYNAEFISLQFYGRQLSVSVPVMTSNTAPYGEASASSIYSSSYDAYKAFDNNTNNWWSSATNQVTNQYIRYKFNSLTRIKMMVVTNYTDTTKSAKNIKFQYKDTSWHDEDSFVNPSTSNTVSYYDVDGLGTEFGLLCVDNYGSSTEINVKELQFYGLDYSEKEFEAGTTKKWLYDHGVELETIGTVGSNTIKGDSYIELNDNGSNFHNEPAFDITPYSLLRGKVGDIYNPTAELYCGSDLSAISQWTANNLPYTNALDVSSINETKNCGVYKINNSKARFTELWLE